MSRLLFSSITCPSLYLIDFIGSQLQTIDIIISLTGTNNMLENQTAPMFSQKFTKDQFLATEIFSPSLEHNLLVFFGETVFQAASLFHSRENVMTKARRQVVNVVTSDRDVRVLNSNILNQG